MANNKDRTPGNFDVQKASEIKLKQLDYFWHDRLPFGQIIVAAGRPGGGKSTIMSDIVAHVTRDLKGGAVLSNQEDAESVVRARLEAANADLDKVFMPTLGYRFPNDLNLLALHIEKNDARVAIFDAAAQHLAVNMGNDQDVRQALSPLAKLADATGCSMIFVTHVVKHFSKNAHPLTAIGGSGGGLPGAARSIFFVGPNPDNIQERACVWVKDQYRQVPAALTFEVEQYEVEDDEQKIKAMTQRAILVDDAADIDPVAVLTGKAKDDDGGPRADKRAGAAEWLTVYLSTGAKPAKDLRDDAAKQGISWATIRRSADDVGIEKYRKGFGKGSQLFWQLPDGHPALAEESDLDADAEGWITADMLTTDECQEVCSALETFFHIPAEDTAPLSDEDFEAGLASLLGPVDAAEDGSPQDAAPADDDA